MIIPAGKWEPVHGTQDLVKQYEQQYSDGLITKGEKYNKVVDAWQQCSDKVAEEMMQAIQAVQQTKRPDGRYQQPNAIWMMAHSGCPWLGGADQAAGRHARPDGEAFGRDHREPDHLELQGRPDRARVLQLDARRPQGSGRHRAQDGELGLPHPPSGRRRPGLHHHRRGLRHRAVDHDLDPGGSEDLGERILGRTVAEDIVHPRTGEVLAPRNTLLDEELCRRIDRRASTASRCARC